ncbi:hypothetical protein TrVE_jg1494 [Triparma verrucosa]|uniref:Uncharacterized protein n=1 Tax=Triparma verrucosa TaxID=1606542 RepID=A0A9W7BYF1_9STRA|nr:hypothetical protein TrVE_jg1494 [Triparma verrucosa]
MFCVAARPSLCGKLFQIAHRRGTPTTGLHVSTDPSTGHLLTAISASKSSTYNLTIPSSTSSPPVQWLSSVPEFSTVINPCISKIPPPETLSGTVTPLTSLTVETVSMFLAQKESFDVTVSNLMELKHRTHNREATLGKIKEENEKQIQVLMKAAEELLARKAKSDALFTQIKTFQEALLQRSTMILAASRSLSSNLTSSEKHFHSQLRQWSSHTSNLEIEVNQMRSKTQSLRDLGREEKVQLNEGQKEMCEDLVRGEGVLIKKVEECVERIKSVIN